MLSDKSVFKPRYPAPIRLINWVAPLLFFLLLIGGALIPSQLSTLFWLAALILGFITSLQPFFLVREILFMKEMVVRRYFLPDLFYEYQEVTRIDPDAIWAGRKRIHMGYPLNLNELKEMYQRWSAARVLKEAARSPEPHASHYPTRGYGAYASFWGLLLGVIALFLQPRDFALDPRWLLGGTFMLIYLVYIYVLPKYL